MRFLGGLLPGLFIGIALGLSGTAIARHARLVAKVLVKAGIVAGAAVGRLFRGVRVRFAALVAEARAELAQAEEDREPEPVGPWAEHDIGRWPADTRDGPSR